MAAHLFELAAPVLSCTVLGITPRAQLFEQVPPVVHCARDDAPRTFLSRLSQKDAMSSALELPATDLLQNASNASLSDLWNRDAFMKQVDTYTCGHAAGGAAARTWSAT